MERLGLDNLANLNKSEITTKLSDKFEEKLKVTVMNREIKFYKLRETSLRKSNSF